MRRDPIRCVSPCRRAYSISAAEYRVFVRSARAAARAGDPAATHRLGLVRQQGLAGAPHDPRLATRYFETAAQAGHPWARFRLAQMLDASGADRARSLELDRAQVAERDYARRLQLLWTYTAAYWASAPYAAYWWRPYGYCG